MQNHFFGRRYTSLIEKPESDEGLLGSDESTPRARNPWALYLCIGVLIALGSVLGFVLGSTRQICPFGDSARCQVVPHVFTRETDIYSVPASSESNHAWRLLFPKHGAEFVNPPEQPELFSLTVFHQLHCLASIRLGFFAAQDQQPLEDVGTNEAHIRHCIDFLRQSVMCYADTTREMVNTTFGYDVPHQCRDWDEVLASTDGWIADRSP